MKVEIYPKWRERFVLPSLTAYCELGDLKLDLHDVVEILEHGEDCSGTKRKHGTIEKCMQIGKKYVKIVVVEDWSISLNEHVWLITHAGATKRRKKR